MKTKIKQAVNLYTYLNFAEFSKINYWDYESLKEKKSIESNFPVVELAKVIQQRKEFIVIEDNKEYKRCRVQLYAKGVVLRDTVLGSEIRTKRQQLCRKDDFVVAEIDAKFGGYGIVPEELESAIVSSHYFLFRVDTSMILPSYLAIVCKLSQFSSQVKATGSTNYSAIRPYHVLTYKIPLPTLDVQREIVKQYNISEEEISGKAKQIDEIEGEKVTFLNKAFGIQENRLPARNTIEMIDFSSLERWGVGFSAYRSRWIISPKFEQREIKSLCKIGSGGTPSTGVERYYGGDIPWIKTTEVKNNLILETEDHLTIEGLQNSSAKLYPEGSLVIAMYGQGATRGRTAKLGISAATNQACAVLHQIDNSTILTDFLWIYLMNEYHRLRELASGNNQPNLNAGMIGNYLVQVPPLSTQRRIIEKIKVLDGDIQSLSDYIEQNENKAIETISLMLYQKKNASKKSSNPEL